MVIRYLVSSMFAMVMFFGMNVASQFVSVAIADDALVCDCSTVAEAKSKADKADKDAKDAKDAKDKADKEKSDIDNDEHASDADKHAAKEKADKADKDAKDAKDSKDKADKEKSDVDGKVAGAPCTCPNGGTGFWNNISSPAASSVPAAFRELHGK